MLKVVSTNDVRDWYMQAVDLAEFTRTIGGDLPDVRFDLPAHLQFTIAQLARERQGADVGQDVFNSIPFYSLCKGLFLPLASLPPDRVVQLFGIASTHTGEPQQELIKRFLSKSLGLNALQKIACLLGDPFLGKRSSFRRDSLVRLLRSMRLAPRAQLLDRLTIVGDIAALFAEMMPTVQGDPPLTSLEVFETLRFIPGQRQAKKFEVLRSLYERCGKLEAYFLTKLLLRNAGFGFEYQGPLLSKLLAEQFHADADQVEHAMALTSPLQVVKILSNEGAIGLRKIQLRPLSPVRPALATGSVTDIAKYPVWVERKYDGVRLLLHKSTDTRGSVLCGAYTRNRGDWLEIIPGMSATIPYLPAHSAIVDGELFGTIVTMDGARPASVYEVFTTVQGEPIRPVQLKYAAFDLIYLNGQDLTGLPLAQRRQYLQALVGPVAGMPLPIPMMVSEGQMADTPEDLNRLFHHFRAQGYEGIIAKDLAGTYHLAARDPSWVKRKPEITLDLVLLGGVYAVTSKEHAGLFGSYVVGAKTVAGDFEIAGDVAGLDRLRDQQIQSEVMRLGLLTGRRIERPSASGVRPGLEFRPAIVVTVKFEGITRHDSDGRLSLRDPKIALIRSDKSAHEADEIRAIEQLYLDQRLS
jgi:DNA ligase 1